jgi:hypothetical protein
MKAKMAGLLGGLSFLVLLAASPARANDLTIFGGVQNPSEFTFNTVTSTVTVNPRNFGVFGARVSLGSVIGTEQTLAYSPNFIASDHSAIIYNSNLMVHIPVGRVRPYGTVGVGTVYVRGEEGVLGTLTGAKFAVNYGGGLKIGLAPHVGIQVDARGYSVYNLNGSSMRMLEVSSGLVLSF